MKKLSVLLSLILVLSLLFSPAASAAGGNTDTLGDWNIRIAVPDQAAAAVLEGSTYYIYAQKEGYIPYVMLMATDRFDNEDAFIDEYLKLKEYGGPKSSNTYNKIQSPGKKYYENRIDSQGGD